MSSLVNHVNYSSDSIASSDNMSISPSPLIAYQARRTPTPDLEYADETSPSILFGTTEHIQPVYLRPLKLDDDDEDKPIPPPSDSPTVFDEAYPAQIRIKVEEFEETHNAREVEAKANKLLISTLEVNASFVNSANNSFKSSAQLLKKSLKS
jgi:hypothetical protein